jgi:hypothetical protein
MPKRDEFAHDNNDQDSEDDNNDRDSKDDEELMLSGSSSSDDSDGEGDKSDEAMETEKFSPNHSIVHSHSHYPSNSMYLPRQLAAGQYRPDGESDVERDQEVILGIFHSCSNKCFLSPPHAKYGISRAATWKPRDRTCHSSERAQDRCCN